MKKLILFLAVSLIGYCPPPVDASDDGCLVWAGEISLQDAVNQNYCVSIVPGTYVVTSRVRIGIDIGNSTGQAQNIIHGNGATIVADWVPTRELANEGIFRIASDGFLTISNITLDGANKASYLVSPHRYHVSNVRAINGACSAFGIGGHGVTITATTMVHNGWNCLPYSLLPLGAAIYGQHQGTQMDFKPVITHNTITDSYGPGVDINGVWGGTFVGNTVYGNTGWAGVSLYGSSNWMIAYNQVSHPATTEVLGASHPFCTPTPLLSAAIFVCQDTEVYPLYSTGNTIALNQASSGFGILLVGADEVKPWMSPRLTNVAGNIVTGSLVGCADDQKVGQWMDGNTWVNNNCKGVPNSSPIRF